MTISHSHLTILSAQQMQAVDHAVIESGVPSFTLMRAAGEAVASIIMQRYPKSPILILAGAGNNGGDGFVIAQTLSAYGWDVTLATLTESSPKTPDAIQARAYYRGNVSQFEPSMLDRCALLVDAVFGTGLSSIIPPDVSDVIARVRARGIPVVAVDIPSGVDASTGGIHGDAFDAELTVTFVRKKRGHLLYPGREKCAEVVVADIGISDAQVDVMDIKCYENDPQLWRHVFPVPHAASHKYTRGHTLVVGGDIAHTGATKLAARAALRAGCGLVSVVCDEISLPVYAAGFASIMTIPISGVPDFQRILQDSRVNTVIVGPANGVTEHTLEMTLAALAAHKKVVIDADAISVFAGQPETLASAIESDCILTPHTREFERLFNNRDLASESDKVARALAAASVLRAVVVLKGADTIIASPEGTAVINTNATADLATAGSGDVLAGICGGLLAQGMPVFEAACASVWLHGAAASSFGAGLISEDLTEILPTMLRFVRNIRM